MSFALLSIELLLAVLLMVATIIRIGVRKKSKGARVASYVLGLFASSLPVAAIVAMTGMVRFVVGIQSDTFWFALLMAIVFLIACMVIWKKAFQSDISGLPRAVNWPLRRLQAAWFVVVALIVMTFWNLTLQAQVEIQATRAEAAAIALSSTSPLIPDSLNAAYIYQQATDRYNASLTDADKDINKEVKDYRDLDPRSPEVTAYLSRQQKTLELIRRAADMPQYRPDYDYRQLNINSLIKDLPSLRSHSNLLLVAAKSEAATGNIDLALDDCRRNYALAAHMGSGPLLINGLVAIAIDSLASKSLADILPTLTTKEQLDRLPVLDSRVPSRIIVHALYSEEAYGLAAFCDRWNGNDPDHAPNPAFASFGSATWIFWLHNEVTVYRENLQRVRELADQPFYKVAPQWKELQALGNPSTGQRRSIVADSLLSSFTVTIQFVTEDQALRASATLAIAAIRYRLAKGSYPDKPEALVPDFIDSLPLDPFDGKPIRYKKTDAGIVLYSIGRDLADNGGDVESKPQATSRPADVGIILRVAP